MQSIGPPPSRPTPVAMLLWASCILATGPKMVGAYQEVRVPPARTGNQAFTTSRGIPEYRIGPGDELRIRIWTGMEAKQYDVTVQTDKTIFLPLFSLANLNVKDQSSVELRDDILERLRVSYRRPAVEVVITKRVARIVTLLGEVRTTLRADSGPGRYPLPGLIRLVDFVTEHGGVTQQADINNTQLIRNQISTVYNLSLAVFQGDESQNPVLDEGDLIYIPPLSTSSRKIMIFGEVGNAGLLELPTEVTVAEALARSGGLTPDAHRSRIVVIRGSLEEPTLLTCNFKALNEGDLSQNISLQDGDMVFVGRRAFAGFRDVMQAFAVPLSLIYTAVLINEVSGR